MGRVRALHPPGVRLTVVLSGHNVLKELSSSDPAEKHTGVTDSGDPVISITLSPPPPSPPLLVTTPKLHQQPPGLMAG